MNPIYDGYIKFLRDMSGDKLPDLKEGYFWLNRQIIKGFDKQGSIHKFYKVVVSEDLERVEIKKLKTYDNIQDIDLASWQELIDLNKEHLIQIQSESLNLIKEKMQKYENYTSIIPVSMGKDSMVTCHLVRSLYLDTKAIFNNTSLDCADTYQMVKGFPNCEIMNPDKGFYQYVASDNMIPTRFSRFCCRIFKTGVMASQLENQMQEALMRMNGLTKPNGAKLVGKEFYLLENGQSLISGCIQYGEIFLLILSIRKDIPELDAIVLAHFIRNLHGFLTNIGI